MWTNLFICDFNWIPYLLEALQFQNCFSDISGVLTKQRKCSYWCKTLGLQGEASPCDCRRCWRTEGQPSLSLSPSSCRQPLSAKAHQQASLSPSTTIHHHTGCRGRMRGLGSVAPRPLLVFSENPGLLCHRQQPHSCFTTFTMQTQIYSGEDRPAPFYCSSAPSPLSLAPPAILLFLSPTPFSPDSTPSPSHRSFCSLSPFLLPFGAPFLLLCSTSPGPGVWAVLIAEEK